jgi:hypothetical protein
MEDDSNVNIDLKSLAMNLKMEICGRHSLYIPSLTKHDEKRASNMLSMMSNPRYKSLRLIFFFIDCEQDMIIKYSIFN